jgi:heme/copper-type cytochrome/quinol oxidase subunit 4
MKHSQTKAASLIESLVSNTIGFFLTVIAQLIFFEDQKFTENLAFSGFLLVLHIFRSYWVRRGFNHYTMKKLRAQREQRKQHKALQKALKRELKERDEKENLPAVQ